MVVVGLEFLEGLEVAEISWECLQFVVSDVQALHVGKGADLIRKDGELVVSEVEFLHGFEFGDGLD